MYITVSQQIRSVPEVNKIAQTVSDKIEKSGLAVFRTTITTPGKHYASDFIDGMGALLGVLGVLAILLSGFLTVNTITALLNQQIRQIGIMKTYGAQTVQLIKMYLSLVMCFGAMALLVALPLSAVGAYAVAGQVAGFLNFKLSGFRIPLLALILQVFVALLVPAVSALAPVMSGARISIRAAINDFGSGTARQTHSWIDTVVEKLRDFPRPLLLSLRNVFRRKGRLFLTLSTLVLGGCIFIAVFNVRTALNISIQDALGYFLSDVNVNFARPYRTQEIEKLIPSIPGVIDVEGWGASGAQVLRPDENNSDEVIVSAPPSDSKMIKPVITGGRWMRPGDEARVVISNQLIKKRPDLKVGDDIMVKVNGKKYHWQIIGTCSIAGQIPIPIMYTNNEYLETILNAKDTASEFHILTSPEDKETQYRVARTLEVVLKRAGLQVSKISTGNEMSSRLLVLINMMVVMLLGMAVLIAVVGGLGLMGMMSQNVFDRTREIGVMRAIGADNRAIRQMVIVEGVVIGLISWVLALFLAFPVSMALENAVGIPIIGAPLPIVLLSPDGPLMWLVIVTGLSALASYLPARSASNLTIREVLAYE
jgi:putative ABC transport system permease protein